MPQIINGKTVYQAGEALPTVGSQEYINAQKGKITPVDNSMLQGSVTPQIKTAPQPTGDSAFYESLVDSTKEQDAEATRVKELETKMKSDEQGIAGLLTQIGGAGQKQEEFIQQEGGDVAKKEYDQYTAQLKAEQLALRRKQEALAKNPQGLFGGALADEQKRIERESLSKQADLAILQETARGNYQTAYDIAERKTQAYLEPLKTQLEIKKFFFENNKDLFNKAEQRQYDAKIKKEEREYEKEELRTKTANEMIVNALSLGAPSSLIANANAKFKEGAGIVEIASALGKYSGDYLSNEIKRASLAKTNAEITKLKNEIKASETPLDVSGLPNTAGGIATKLMASAQNDKQLDATERQQLSKARTVIGQLDALQSNIGKQNTTGFIKGKTANLLEKIGQNADAGVINAQLQALTPNLARGVYGEVGVLTDNDVRLYRTTLPRLDRPQDQNDAVLALTLRTVQKSIENTLTGAANSGIDVSGWTQDYMAITKQINDIEDRIGISKAGVDELASQDPSLVPVIKELYQSGLTDGEILEALNAR